MKLSQHIIYYQLKKQHSIRYAQVCETVLSLGRPVFLRPGQTVSNSVLITGPDDSELHETITGCAILCCCGSTTKKHPSGNCVIVVDADERDVFNCVQEIFNLFDDWDASLKNICGGNGGSYQDLIDCADTVTVDPICICDRHFRYIGYSKEKSREWGLDLEIDSNNCTKYNIVNELILNPAFGESENRRDFFIYHMEQRIMLCKNLFNGDEYVGRMIILFSDTSDCEQCSYSESILKHLYIYTDILYSKYRSFSHSDIVLGELRRAVSAALNSDRDVDQLWKSALEGNGWQLGDSLFTVLLKAHYRYNNVNIYPENLGAEIERMWQGCIYFVHDENLFLIINRDKFSSKDGNDLMQALVYLLRENLLVAGLSRNFSNAKYLTASCKQTVTALDFGMKLHPSFWYFKFDDCTLDYMLSKSLGDFEPEHICSAKVLELARHDTEHGSEYIKTLKVYFDCKYNAVEAARRLFIHRSSFIGRLERMQKLVNINFDSPDEQLYIGLSLKLI